MLNTINIDLKTDIKTDKPKSLPITLMSQDKNNNQFILRFKNGGEAITLDDSYTVEVLTKFRRSGTSRLTSAIIRQDHATWEEAMTKFGIPEDSPLAAAKNRQDYATWEFDTSYITRDEEVRNYVYVRKDGELLVSADANCFVFHVGLSEVDKDAGKVAETYDKNYQKYLDEFKENVNFEEIAQAEQARKEAESDRELAEGLRQQQFEQNELERERQTSLLNDATGTRLKYWAGSQAEYDAIETYDLETVYDIW